MNAKQWAQKVQEASFAELPKLYEQMGWRMAIEVSRLLDNNAQFRVREAEYLEYRARGASHDQANKAQNRRIKKVRKAMGYTYRDGEDDLNVSEVDDE